MGDTWLHNPTDGVSLDEELPSLGLSLFLQKCEVIALRLPHGAVVRTTAQVSHSAQSAPGKWQLVSTCRPV